ncbi:hypothetical protein QE418_000699 [Microbacterium testaceum]|nr:MULTISPECIES: hypothetical protein [Microbacterium]MDQ1111251.1 hypothetical protein [Microbacterium testaceum]MDR6098211.1 hypothetical protein [Microbacterium sp. SORGH_AS_0454]
MSTANSCKRLSRSIRLNDLVPDHRKDGFRILAGELETLDQIVERRPMDTQLRGQVRDRLAPFVPLNDGHLLVVSQLPSLPRQTSLCTRTPARSRCGQLKEVGAPA